MIRGELIPATGVDLSRISDVGIHGRGLGHKCSDARRYSWDHEGILVTVYCTPVQDKARTNRKVGERVGSIREISREITAERDGVIRLDG